MIRFEPSRLRLAVKLGLPLFIIFWSINSLLGVSPYDYSDSALRTFGSEKSVFVSDFLAHDIEGHADFDGAPIRALCDSKTWRKDLILSCDPVPGGLGQVRNAALNCIRLAIEAGAELILPTMIARDPRDITKLDPSRGPPKHTLLGHFFDVDHLNASLARFCPQMRVHASVHDLYDVPSILEPLKATHREMGNVFVNETLLDAPQLWGSRLLQWVEKKTKGSSSDGLPGKDGDEKPSDIGVATIKAGLPVRVNIERSIFTWPNSHDSPQLARAFGRLLRVRGDARRIAATVLFRLQKRFRLSLDPRQYGTAGPRRESFVGVHLRTERDVAVTAPNVFPEYAFQAADYAAYVAESKIPVVFLATGASPENVTAFAERMAKLNVTVVTKMDLLQDEDGPERSALEDLTFDQRGLIDYEVMLRAGLVAGRCESAFAWQLVLRRASAFAGIVGGDTKIRPHDGYRYQDRYSALFGKPDCSNMMQASIWP